MGSRRKTEERHVTVKSTNLPPDILKWFEDHGQSGFENVTIKDVGLVASSVHEEIHANKLERDMILNTILFAVIRAHPKPEKKNGDGPKLARLSRARAELLGETLKRGRRTQVDAKKLNIIAKRYLKVQLDQIRSGSRVQLDPIIKDVLLPNRVAEGLSPEKIENGIKGYRKAFRENQDWLLMRHSQMLALPKGISADVRSTIALLLFLTGKKRKKLNYK